MRYRISEAELQHREVDLVRRPLEGHPMACPLDPRALARTEAEREPDHVAVREALHEGRALRAELVRVTRGALLAERPLEQVVRAVGDDE